MTENAIHKLTLFVIFTITQAMRLAKAVTRLIKHFACNAHLLLHMSDTELSCVQCANFPFSRPISSKQNRRVFVHKRMRR
jgi:catabolite regulation protein CreA